MFLVSSSIGRRGSGQDYAINNNAYTNLFVTKNNDDYTTRFVIKNSEDYTPVFVTINSDDIPPFC